MAVRKAIVLISGTFTQISGSDTLNVGAGIISDGSGDLTLSSGSGEAYSGGSAVVAIATLAGSKSSSAPRVAVAVGRPAGADGPVRVARRPVDGLLQAPELRGRALAPELQPPGGVRQVEQRGDPPAWQLDASRPDRERHRRGDCHRRRPLCGRERDSRDVRRADVDG